MIDESCRRKRATAHHPTLVRDLEAIVEPTAPGDPDSPLRWTCLSTRTLAVALDALGYSVSHTVVAELLHGLGYSLQGNVKRARAVSTRIGMRSVNPADATAPQAVGVFYHGATRMPAHGRRPGPSPGRGA